MVPSRSILSCTRQKRLVGFFKTQIMKNIKIILVVFTTLLVVTYSFAQDYSKATGEWILQHIVHHLYRDVLHRSTHFLEIQ